MQVNLHVETVLSKSPRVKQLSAMFDVPLSPKSVLDWAGEFPIEADDWNVGLIVGPSGCGKSQIARHVFGEPEPFTWSAPAVIDDFRAGISMQDITDACSGVGFNTIPAWMRPYAVLSTGEKFRVELARALLERGDPIVIDEFTSVVDRQVAQIGSYAVQKFVRKHGRKFVAVSCHHDVNDWLQPDWVLEPATMTFTRRLLQRRPAVEVEVRRIPYDAWSLFAPYHYLTAHLHRAARCFGAFVNGRLVAFAGLLNRPHPTAKNIIGVSRLVTLPDWQGLGLAMVLVDTVGAAYRACDMQLRTYPAHPALVRSFDRSTQWGLEKKPGAYSTKAGKSSSISSHGGFGDRPCAVFRYVGNAIDEKEARAMLAGAYV